MELTIKEFAALERVDERTVRRWIEKGAVPVRRTPGGGIRIADRRVTVLTLTDDERASSDKRGHSAA
jgi:excisionase family DNA binding protein